ncbi:jhamt [Trichonephila clavata]|uniref:Jhamt n=1 Tax=Trichonephila clavata TaxID=2740835 RepID=A0A8X6LZK1_TRICU|nr:jhamt [Trichonephila clavata]
MHQVLHVKTHCKHFPSSQISEMAQAKVLNEQILEKAREFITRCKTELNWEDLSEDTVMDIGCGSDFLCSRALLEKFPRMGCLLAIDTVSFMTSEIMADEFFAEYFRNATLQLHLVDIMDSSGLEDYRNFIHKIVCRNMLHQVADKELAFKNMYDMLRPGGHAGIIFCLANDICTWQIIISSSKNWGQYKRESTPFFIPANQEDNYYKDMLEDLGFRVVRCERKDVQMQFSSDQSLLKILLPIAKTNLNIPADRMTQFKEESVSLFKILINYSGNGPLHYKASEILLLAIKQ